MSLLKARMCTSRSVPEPHKPDLAMLSQYYASRTNTNTAGHDSEDHQKRERLRPKGLQIQRLKAILI